MNPDSSVSTAAVEPAIASDSQSARKDVRPWKAMVRRHALPTLRYVTATEVHTFAFSVAANAILSFFPFVVLLSWLVHNVLHSPAMFQVITDLLKNQLPTGQDFVVKNLTAVVQARHRVKIASVIILLISSSGVFLPLEVAFNRVWGFARNRSYLGNQIISFLLACACGVLGLLSVGLAAGNKLFLSFIMGGHEDKLVFQAAAFVLMKSFAMVATVGIFFLIYWLLPHGKVPAKRVLSAAIIMGLVWEAAKYAYILALPWLNFHEVYGPFTISVTLMVWAYISGLLVLAGAYLAAMPFSETSGDSSPRPRAL
jgi:membrane protein